MNARGAALYTFTLCPWFVSDELGVVAFRAGGRLPSPLAVCGALLSLAEGWAGRNGVA